MPSVALADSSSPLLAAYYDRYMAVIGGTVFYWSDDERPRKTSLEAVQVGVGDDSSYILKADGRLVGFRDDPDELVTLDTDVTDFSAGEYGVLVIKTSRDLWWMPGLDGSAFWQKGFADKKQLIARGVRDAAVGDGANYYVTGDGALFVQGKAHRGQYGDGKLTATDHFVQTASDVAEVQSNSGHALMMTSSGEIFGTGGNIYGPVGPTGLGDKADRWSSILKHAAGFATGYYHSVAITGNGALLAWGRGYGPDPVAVMSGVTAVAAGTDYTLAIKEDGTLWQWERGEDPKPVELK